MTERKSIEDVILWLDSHISSWQSSADSWTKTVVLAELGRLRAFIDKKPQIYSSYSGIRCGQFPLVLDDGMGNTYG